MSHRPTIWEHTARAEEDMKNRLEWEAKFAAEFKRYLRANERKVMSKDTWNDPTNYSNTFGTTAPDSILNTANKIIYGDREATYGHPAKNLKTIASYWQTHLEAKGIQFITELTTDDVCVMMILLKQARLANDPKHKDSQVDTCGYAALMERCQDFEKNSTQVDVVAPAAPT